MMLTVGAAVQTLAALSWLTVRWWRWGYGIAATFKSAALAAILDVLVFGWWFFVPDTAWAVLATLLTAGITIQYAFFVRERWGDVIERVFAALRRRTRP